jgi:uncharacterized OsmC-like protein
MKVQISTLHNSTAAVGWSKGRSLTIDRSAAAGGLGIGFSGGELLFLAIGGCFTNDLFREAARRGIRVESARVEVEGDWGGDPARAQNVVFTVTVESDAEEAAVQELIAHTDRVAEIPNSLRFGATVRLARLNIVRRPRGNRADDGEDTPEGE